MSKFLILSFGDSDCTRLTQEDFKTCKKPSSGDYIIWKICEGTIQSVESCIGGEKITFSVDVADEVESMLLIPELPLLSPSPKRKSTPPKVSSFISKLCSIPLSPEDICRVTSRIGDYSSSCTSSYSSCGRCGTQYSISGDRKCGCVLQQERKCTQCSSSSCEGCRGKTKKGGRGGKVKGSRTGGRGGSRVCMQCSSPGCTGGCSSSQQCSTCSSSTCEGGCGEGICQSESQQCSVCSSSSCGGTCIPLVSPANSFIIGLYSYLILYKLLCGDKYPLSSGNMWSQSGACPPSPCPPSLPFRFTLPLQFEVRRILTNSVFEYLRIPYQTYTSGLVENYSTILELVGISLDFINSWSWLFPKGTSIPLHRVVLETTTGIMKTYVDMIKNDRALVSSLQREIKELREEVSTLRTQCATASSTCSACSTSTSSTSSSVCSRDTSRETTSTGQGCGWSNCTRCR